jgi:hypothetical protein
MIINDIHIYVVVPELPNTENLLRILCGIKDPLKYALGPDDDDDEDVYSDKLQMRGIKKSILYM